MDQTLSLGWMQGEARSRRATYQRLLRVSLILEALIGHLALLWPSAIINLLGLPPGGAWTRAWGGAILFAAALHIPALQEPVRWRWGNVAGIGGRLILAFVYLLLGGGFLWLALIEAVLGVLLARSYY